MFREKVQFGKLAFGLLDFGKSYIREIGIRAIVLYPDYLNLGVKPHMTPKKKDFMHDMNNREIEIKRERERVITVDGGDYIYRKKFLKDLICYIS